MKERIGFIGLGIMGRPMAGNLLDAGYGLIVHNRSRAAVDELAGAVPASTAGEVAEQADVIITMLPDSPQVSEVVSEMLTRARRGQLLIDMSTIAPATARELAARAGERGVDMLDAPVSGGDVGARQGTLSIMVGGPRPAFERAKPVLGRLGSTVTHVGGSGAGQVVKACNQVVVALVIEAVSEALVLGGKAGVDRDTILGVLSGGLAANKVMEVRGRNFLEHDFAPGFRVDLHHKDLGIALATARACGAVLPGTAAVDQMFESLRQRGCGGYDHSSLLLVLESLSGNDTRQAEQR